MLPLASTLPLATNPVSSTSAPATSVYDWTGNAQLAQPRTCVIGRPASLLGIIA